MANYVYHRVICDGNTLQRWLLDDAPFGEKWKKQSLSFNRLFNLSTVEEYTEKVGLAISYGLSTSVVKTGDDQYVLKFVTRWAYPIEAIKKLLEVSHETVWQAIEENCVFLSCFYWHDGVREKVKYYYDNANLWEDEREHEDPGYWDRFEDPDYWIWEYVDISREPWVEWPDEDGFHRYDKAIIDVVLPEFIVQSSERREE